MLVARTIIHLIDKKAGKIMATAVGLVGVGLMGHGIAFNLVTKGFHVSLLAHPGNQPLDELTAA